MLHFFAPSRFGIPVGGGGQLGGQGEERLDSYVPLVSLPAAAGFFSLDASSSFLATASASAPAMFLDSALCSCGVICMI